MMRCPNCDTENPEQARFCVNCGDRLVLACPECGTELPPQARFCFICGTQVSAPPTEAEEEPGGPALGKAIQRLVPKEFAERLLATRGQVTGERRIVTILFSDVKGSMAMAENLDPEDVMEIMDGAFDVLIEPITRYEGTLARLMGDAILAFFGAPIAHEDDPERACRAALEIIEGAQRYAARLEESRGIRGFNVRVGINTGLVVVGEVGSDLRVEYTAMGDAVNLAARMEEAADPGTILITEDTHKLIAPLFETESLGRIEVRGKAEPVSVYRVLASRAVPSKLRGIAELESPLVGRGAEFAALGEAVERLRVGVGGIVTIVGEAGLGKSRLVAELRKDASSASLQWVEGRCLSYGTSIAYLLWLDALRGLLGMTVEDSPVAVRDALWQLVQDLCPDDFDNVYPYLGQLMSLPLTTEEETLLRGLEGKKLKARTFHAVETLIECAASDRPLVLVCEDLHWADSISIELLEQLLAVTDRAPLLFICAFRPRTEHGSWRLKETVARDYGHRHTDLWLEPLSAAESEALVGNLLRVEDLPPRLKWRILSHAEGNPFYVEEIIRSLIDEGAIVQAEATGRWQATRDVADIPIPDSVQGVLIARVDRLPEEVKRVLQMAAVVGRIFLYRVLAAIAEGERKLDECLITLQREGMIRERTRFPEPEYIFKHELTREAAYSGLLKRDRRIFHRRAAEALERLFPDRIDEQPELLAYHWECAQEVDKAICYLFQAGERARRLGASLEAVEFYQSAIDKAAGRDETELTVKRHRIHERLGDVYMENLSRLGEALEHYTAFMELSASDEDAARAARKVATVHLVRGELSEAQDYYGRALARLRSSPALPEVSRVHYGLAYLLVQRHQLDEATQHARKSLEIAQRIGDTRGLADAHRVMGIIAIQQGDLQKACRCDERSLELYRQVGDLPRMVQACNNVGDNCRLLGQVDRALERLREGLEIARRIGDTRDEALLLQTTGELFLDQGEWERAIACLERALPVAEESDVRSRILDTHRVLGLAYQGVGRLEEARHHLETAESLMRETEQFRFAPRLYLDLASLNAAQDMYDEAQECIRLAQEAAGEGPSDAFLGLMHACSGHLDGHRGRWDDAAAHFEKGIRFLEHAHLLGEVAKTHLSLGTAYGNRGLEGDRGRACEQLLAALSLFQQMQARGYVAEVETHLEELGCRNEDSGALLNQETTLSSKVTDS